jgi:hypothetical protein
VNDDQQAIIASLEAQEEQLVFTRFSNEDAWLLGSAMVSVAIERALPVTIDIRRHGQQLFHAALPGTTADGLRHAGSRWTRRRASSPGCSRRTAHLTATGRLRRRSAPLAAGAESDRRLPVTDEDRIAGPSPRRRCPPWAACSAAAE